MLLALLGEDLSGSLCAWLGAGVVWKEVSIPLCFHPKMVLGADGDVCDMAGLSPEPWEQTHPCEQVRPRC